MKWEKVKLGDLCDITSSKRVHLAERVTYGVPFYCSKEIILKRKHEDVTECDFISENIWNDINKKYGTPHYRDILVTTRGTIGVPYFYKKEDKFYFADGNLTWIKNYSSNLYPEFLYYWLDSQEGFLTIDALAKGTAQKALSINGLKSIEIPLPPVKIQQKTANILSAYDDLIENNQKQIKILEEAAQRIYKEWFVDLRFPGHENVKIADGIPEGWENTNLGSIDCCMESGSRPKGGINKNCDSNSIPSIGAENVIGLGKYNFSSDKYITKEFFAKMRRGILKNKDILIYKDGAYIGRTTLFQDDFPHKQAAVNEHVFLLHATDESLQYYLFFTLYQQEYFQKMQSLNKNAAQPGLNQNAVFSLDFVLPNKVVINQFNSVIEPIMSKLFIKAKQIKLVQEARDRLLNKLMSGELGVE